MRRVLVMLGMSIIASMGCSGEQHNQGAVSAPSSTAITTQASAGPTDTYAHDMRDLATLVGKYVRHWDQTGDWPVAGTYQSANLIYKGTEASSRSFPTRRRDFYRTLHDGGLELDLMQWTDGTCEVFIIKDIEP